MGDSEAFFTNETLLTLQWRAAGFATQAQFKLCLFRKGFCSNLWQMPSLQ